MNTVKIILATSLAYILAMAVVMSSLHIKDIVANNNEAAIQAAQQRTARAHMEDVSAKAMSELHNHVEKTMVKSLVKAMSDPAVVGRQRQTIEDAMESDRGLSVVLMEMLLMFRLSYAFALAR